jgi:hypothetical protein
MAPGAIEPLLLHQFPAQESAEGSIAPGAILPYLPFRPRTPLAMAGVPLPLSLNDIELYLASRTILIDRTEFDAAILAHFMLPMITIGNILTHGYEQTMI